jgi:hypothetical protein
MDDSSNVAGSSLPIPKPRNLGFSVASSLLHPNENQSKSVPPQRHQSNQCNFFSQILHPQFPTNHNLLPKPHTPSQKHHNHLPKPHNLLPKDYDHLPKPHDLFPKEYDLFPKPNNSFPKPHNLVPKPHNLFPNRYKSQKPIHFLALSPTN